MHRGNKKLHECEFHNIQTSIKSIVRLHERTDAEHVFILKFVSQLKYLNFSGEVHTNTIIYHPEYGIRIYDVFLPSKGIFIEIDGQSHHGALKRQSDVEKERLAEELGCEIIRIENGEVFDTNYIRSLASHCASVKINEKNQKRMKQYVHYWRNQLFKAAKLKPPVNRIERPEFKKLGIACYSHFYGCAFHLRAKRPKKYLTTDFSKIDFSPEAIFAGFLKQLEMKKSGKVF